MDIDTKTTCVVSLQDLQDIISEKTGKTATLIKFDVHTEGDYDRGNYKETLRSLTFKLEDNGH